MTHTDRSTLPERNCSRTFFPHEVRAEQKIPKEVIEPNHPGCFVEPLFSECAVSESPVGGPRASPLARFQDQLPPAAFVRL